MDLDRELMDEALERARESGGADVFNVLGEDVPPSAASEGEPPPAARLREPTKAPEEPSPSVVEKAPPPAAVPEVPPPVAKGLGRGAAPKPSSDVDWKALSDNLWGAQMRAHDSRAAEHMFANIVPGYQTDPGRFQSQVDIAKAPLELAQAKQAYEGKQRGLDADAAMRDPNSLQSQKAREMFKAALPGVKLPAGFDNWSASEVQGFLKMQPKSNGITPYELEQLKRRDAATEYNKEKDKTEAERRALERAEDLDWRKTIHEDSQANAAATRALAASAQAKLPAGEAAKLGGSDAAMKAIDALSKDWDDKAADVGSSVTQFIPGADANLYLPTLNTTTQVVGTFLEGGKLTDADVPKYARMMPQPRDTKEQKEAKISALRRLVATKREEEAKALQGSGYNVPRSDAPPVKPAGPKRPAAVPEGAKFINGKWMYRRTDGQVETYTEE